LLTNYETTWYKTNHEVAELVNEKNTIGPIRKMVVHDGHQGPKEMGAARISELVNRPGKEWRRRCYRFRLLWSQSHDLVDGRVAPKSVTAITRQIKPDVYPKVDDDATILLEYENATGIIEASWNWPYGIKTWKYSAGMDTCMH
jgi:hypothetical protein